MTQSWFELFNFILLVLWHAKHGLASTLYLPDSLFLQENVLLWVFAFSGSWSAVQIADILWAILGSCLGQLQSTDNWTFWFSWFLVAVDFCTTPEGNNWLKTWKEESKHEIFFKSLTGHVIFSGANSAWFHSHHHIYTNTTKIRTRY